MEQESQTDARMTGGRVGRGAWRELARSLPDRHARGARRDRLEDDIVAASPPVEANDDRAARLDALDVLMVEAFCRRHGLAAAGPAGDVLAGAAATVSRRLGIPPVITYALYIRANPPGLAEIRRFTPTPEEFRFIRMHRLIEDTFDRVIARLNGVLAAGDPGAALVGAIDDLAAGFRLVNRTVAAFRSPTRMAPEIFGREFRPYFAPVILANGAIAFEGPSGLQSPTFRILGLLAGYRDALFDSWTEATLAYHEPRDRAEIRRAMGLRDGGGSLAALDQAAFGPHSLPHIAPAYGRHAPALTALALADRVVSPGIEAELEGLGVQLGRWPAGAAEPAEGPAAPPGRWPSLAAPDEVIVGAARLEAMLFAFHLEHVATTAYQIGYARGTAGTAGVDFLLLATFRRGLPGLWESEAGRSLVERARATLA